ncbi:PA2169 family four-helix-bundle protein [Robbsia andropogonis]|uniref:PA2169 family four-helix-bundle protein n=1 Tax=Robbsia andropogonis TaxID=28092 RepID=UPI0004632C79|nr:PA2169 family four-helix-bundle protein [Robbsia andropogonis]MCP1119097.1 PA2169 family four-helix-bundle protein [Robbsia andropogonis]MCP1129052.1 PA2169 family four-helix-bundle protein [Robbsia andropogonis]
MTTTTKILNGLIETSIDGEKGFRKAAEDTQDSSLKALFIERAGECAAAVTELQAEVGRLGASPEDEGSFAGTLHRGWLSVKAAVASHDDLAVLEEVERGEDAAKKNYREALAQDLPPEVRTLIEKQNQGVIRNHDRIRDLRNERRAAE